MLGDRGTLHSEKANRRVLHELGRRADCDGEDARDVDANVFHGERAAERDLDLHRFQTQERVVLQKRNDEFRAAVDGQRGRFA